MAQPVSILETHPETAPSTDLVNQVRLLFFKARAHKRSLVAQWSKNYRVVRNRTWLNIRPTWLPNPEVPEILPIVGALVGWMTDQRPTFVAAPTAQPHSPFSAFYLNVAKDLETVLQATWTIHKYDAEIEKAIWDGFFYGTGIFKTGWDNSLDGGLGNAVIRRVDPYAFYPEPDATWENINYMIEAKRMSLQEMDRRWPGSAELFPSGGVTEDIDARPPIHDANTTSTYPNPGAIPPATAPRYGKPGQSRLHATDDPGVTVLEAWLRQHEIITNEDGTKRIYDYWRVVVVAGNYVLMDERADDLWGHGHHPYERYVPFDTGEFWGWSMVELLTSSQLSLNRILASIQHNIDLLGNPPFKESPRAGITRTKITNKPGTRIQVGENATAEWLQPPPLHQILPEMVRFYIGEMERISGLSAIVRGATPTGRNAEGVLDSVQEAAFVRIRNALRNLEWALRSAGEKIANIIVENYTVPRIVSMVGDGGQASILALKGRHFYLPSEDGQSPMRFTILIQAGSSLPTSRAAQVAEADFLFASGALDIPGVLEAHRYPNWQQIAQRVIEQRAQGLLEPPGARQRAQRRQ